MIIIIIIIIRVKYDQPNPRKPQQSPYKHAPLIYGDKVHYAAEDNDRPSLDAVGILRMQSIVGALLFYGHSINNKLLLDFSKLR